MKPKDIPYVPPALVEQAEKTFLPFAPPQLCDFDVNALALFTARWQGRQEVVAWLKAVSGKQEGKLL